MAINTRCEDSANDFLLEKRLKTESPLLHKRLQDSIFVLHHMLSAFLTRFPDFTDHSILHSMDVLDFCNKILGAEQVSALTAEECYVLIMSCYLHDIGMGINDKDYAEFSRQMEITGPLSSNDTQDIVRAFHNEFSGLFIRKYAGLFEIPSEELKFAIIQVSRGHRKTDLYDQSEYPDRISFLAAVLRLADEIDVASERNPELLFDTSRLTQKRDIEAFGIHESIRKVLVREDNIELHIKPKAPEYEPLIERLAGKIQQTLYYCREVAERCSSLRITQKEVIVLPCKELI